MPSKPSSSILTYLRDLIEEASDGLPGVTRRRMFGSDAFFARDNIYAVISSVGRIALKIPDETLYRELLAMPGAEPWSPVGKPMAHWVLVPEDFHDDGELLSEWTRRAHGFAAAAPPKAAGKKKKKP